MPGSRAVVAPQFTELLEQSVESPGGCGVGSGPASRRRRWLRPNLTAGWAA